MLQLNKKIEYALIAILHLDSLKRGDLASAKDVAETYHIPAELLGKVLQALAKASIVESVQGAHGGYRLASPMDDLTLGDVMDVIEGPLHLARCVDAPAACEQYVHCTIREPVNRIQEELKQFIHGIRLSSFRRKAPVEGMSIGAV
jgi:Rrf2 family protein